MQTCPGGVSALRRCIGQEPPHAIGIALDIGFNSRYLLDIAAQLDGEAAVLKLADPGSPTLIQDRDNNNALYVLMPMRV